jgi:outer membrane protein TolC
MNLPARRYCSLLLAGAVLAGGCQPMQPFYLREDGDLSHYLDVATQIEYPDVEEPLLDEVTNALAPLTLRNPEDYEIWELPLDEVVRITLCNSQIIRNIGGQATFTPGITAGIENVTRNIINTIGIATTYDPAIVESGYGVGTGSVLSGTGVEAALSEFDARLDASVFWEKNRRPQNRPDAGFFLPPVFAQDLGNGTIGITKNTAAGTQFSIRHNVIYEGNNTDPSFRPLPSDWQVNLEAGFRHPLLAGGGLQYNRIAGIQSFDQYAAGIGNQIDGVMIARLRTDITLAEFEANVRDLLQDVELNYWDLYFRYRDLQAKMTGRDSALESWRKTDALRREGLPGGEASREAQARSQYYQFKAQVEQALTDLFRAERRLRYIMGISPSDGRLIRPSNEPTTASVAFDWASVHCEAQARREEVRKHKWDVKRRELELIAARNGLLPRIDAVGRYRWLGLGDDLIHPARGASAFNEPGSNAFAVMTSGEFQEWQLGLQASIPIGYRREMAGVRHQELLLARERAVLQELQLEITHQLAEAVSDVELNHALTVSRLNRRVAAEEEVVAFQAQYDVGQVTLDLLLDAQARRAQAESDYYQSLVDYNRAIMRVHYRKGSLLDYDGVYLAEGQWPGKAYFDALRQARKRDASMYLDYGYTRPNVLSRGPYQQDAGAGSEMAPPAGGPQPTPAEELPPGDAGAAGVHGSARLNNPFRQPQSQPHVQPANLATAEKAAIPAAARSGR